MTGFLLGFGKHQNKQHSKDFYDHHDVRYPQLRHDKKARKWLEAQGVNYHFHDYRKDGIDAALVSEFCQALGWENVLNKRGTTFRQLSQEQKDTSTLTPLSTCWLNNLR